MSEPKRLGRPPYPSEVRERAVRMVFEHQGEYPSQWKAIDSTSTASPTVVLPPGASWSTTSDAECGAGRAP